MIPSFDPFPVARVNFAVDPSQNIVGARMSLRVALSEFNVLTGSFLLHLNRSPWSNIT